MTVWRICARRHASRGFSREGARLYGGRWNPPGVAVVYTAATLSLAALELFVNLDPEELPEDLVSISARIPDSLTVDSVSMRELSAKWRTYPAPEELQRIGAAWAREGRTAVLAVPSAVIPQETNFLLNPEHPEFASIRRERAKPFRFDPRMWK